MATDQLTRRTTTVPAALAALVVVLQIAYPLLDGVARDHLTIAVVVVFAATCLAHVTSSRGLPAAVAVLLVTAVPGFVAEVVGVHTGRPFGAYAYAGGLGPKVLGVPPVVALAWTMLAWPAAVVARRLVTGRVCRVLVGAWALTAADLFLDPQMVAAGHWTWQHPTPHLPGVQTIPLTNLAGWLLVSLALSAALQALLDVTDTDSDRTGPDPDAVPILLYLWLYVGYVVALTVFLDLRAAAAWGAVGMGVVAIPLAVREWQWLCRRSRG